MTADGRPDLIGSALTALNLGQLPASFLMLGIAGRLVKRPWAYAATGALALICLIGMMTMTDCGSYSGWAFSASPAR